MLSFLLSYNSFIEVEKLLQPYKHTSFLTSQQHYTLTGASSTALRRPECELLLPSQTDKRANDRQSSESVLKYAAKHKYPVHRSAFTYILQNEQPTTLDYSKSKLVDLSPKSNGGC